MMNLNTNKSGNEISFHVNLECVASQTPRLLSMLAQNFQLKDFKTIMIIFYKTRRPEFVKNFISSHRVSSK